MQRRLADGFSATQTEIAEWAKRKFSLPKAPNQSTTSRAICFQKSKANIKRKHLFEKDRTGTNQRLEKELFSWMCQMFHKRICVSGVMIQEKAKKLQTNSNQQLPTQ